MSEKKKAIYWAELNLVGTSIFCECLGKNIRFTHQGCKHAIGAKIKPIKINLIYISKELIEKSVLLSSISDKLNRSDIKLVHTLLTNYVISDKKYKVYVVVREGINGHVYYDHNAVKVKEI